MTDSRIIDGTLELPTKRTIPARSQPLRAIYVESGQPMRLAKVDPTGLVYTMPDDWISPDDLQAIFDAIDTKFCRPVRAIVVCHALRRAIIIAHGGGGSLRGLRWNAAL